MQERRSGERRGHRLEAAEPMAEAVAVGGAFRGRRHHRLMLLLIAPGVGVLLKIGVAIGMLRMAGLVIGMLLRVSRAIGDSGGLVGRSAV